jgi:SPRY domain
MNLILILIHAGSIIHNSKRQDNYGDPFGPGDVVGCYIFLDDQNPGKNQIRFFKNGKDQGIAYSGDDVPPGVYFPAISLYMEVTHRFSVAYAETFL